MKKKFIAPQLRIINRSPRADIMLDSDLAPSVSGKDLNYVGRDERTIERNYDYWHGRE